MTQSISSPPSGDPKNLGNRATLGRLGRVRDRIRHFPGKFVAVVVVLFVLVAVFGPLFLTYNPVDTAISQRLLPPGSILSNGQTEWMGTDQLGRSILAQTIRGARVSLVVGVGAVLIASVIGLTLGMISGYWGGGFDSFIMRVADIQMAFPGILLAIMIAAVLGPSIPNVIITLAITRWVVFARVVRGKVLEIKQAEFVDASKVVGASSARIMIQDLLPSALPSLMVIATVELGYVIIAEASLSFLGLGTPAADTSWGYIIANGRDYLGSAWWIAVMPGLVLGVVMVSVGRLGDAVRDYLDPTLKTM